MGQKDFREILSKSEEMVHFAGEHTSIHRASMNGAVESGLRVSDEINKELKMATSITSYTKVFNYSTPKLCR